MTAGDTTLTDHGVFTISGSPLKTIVDGINLVNYMSGSRLYFMPAGEGQINLLQLDIAGV